MHWPWGRPVRTVLPIALSEWTVTNMLLLKVLSVLFSSYLLPPNISLWANLPKQNDPIDDIPINWNGLLSNSVVSDLQPASPHFLKSHQSLDLSFFNVCTYADRSTGPFSAGDKLTGN